MATILAVDRDPLQLELLSFLLKQHGHRVYSLQEAEGAFAFLRQNVVELVIVEIDFPRQDGLGVCEQMRRISPTTPLIILSEQHEEDQICRGLLVGADDYVVLPFSPRQLLARIHALLRRANLTRSDVGESERMSAGEITLNFQQMHALVNGRLVQLTHRELSLLHALMANANRVLSRDQLMTLAWGDNFVGTAKAVDVYVLRLRRKLQPYLHSGYIQALRGFGYKFEVPLAGVPSLQQAAG